MSQKVVLASSLGKMEISNEEFSLEKEKQSLQDNEFIAKIIYTPLMDLIHFQIQGISAKEFPFNLGFEASGQILYAKDSSIIGKYVNFYVNQTGTWKQYSKGQLEYAIILEDCKDHEDLKNFAGGCYANPLTAVGLVETALASQDVKCVVNTAGGSSLSLMIHNILQSKGIQTINIIRSSSKVKSLQESLKTQNVVSTDSPTFNEDLKSLIQKYQPTVVLDALGGDVSGQYLKMLPFGSKMINYSHLALVKTITIDLEDTLINHKKVEGFYVNAWAAGLTPEQYLKFHEYISKNYRQFFTIKVSKIYPLEQAEEALNYFMNNQSLGKVLLTNI